MSSSDFPPQLQLRLPQSTTSFKRSFEEFGFDLASPSGDSDGANGSNSSNGNERNSNKRPRSASSLDDEGRSQGSSSRPAASSAENFARAHHHPHPRLPSALAATRPLASNASSSTTSSASGAAHVASAPARSFHEMPLPNPPPIHDIEMRAYLAPSTDSAPVIGAPTSAREQSSLSLHSPYSPQSSATQSSAQSSPVASPHHLATSPTVNPQQNDRLRLSLDRFSAFDTEISALRRSQSISPLLVHQAQPPRGATPPPTLPPLTLSNDQPDLSAVALPFLNLGGREDTTLSQSVDASGSTRRTSVATSDEAISRNTAGVSSQSIAPFEPDLRIDPRLQPTAQRSDSSPNSLPPLTTSTLLQLFQDSPEDITNRIINPTMPGLEFTVMRNRLDSALEPLRSASPLVPELADPPSSAPLPSNFSTRHSHSRTSAPTLPPLRTQLRESTAWDDLSSPYRMFFAPSGSIASGVMQDSSNSMHEDRPAASPSIRPLTFWEGGVYPPMALNVPSGLSTNQREHEDRYHRSSLATETAIGASDDISNLPHTSDLLAELDLPSTPPLDGQPLSRSQHSQHPQHHQLASSSSESLARSSFEGYLPSDEWLPQILRRRSAWRSLDSDEEERLSMDARRLRSLAERREALATARAQMAQAAQAGRRDRENLGVDSLSTLLESADQRPWIDVEADRRRTAASRPLHDPLARPNPAAERHGHERGNVWEETESDRVSGNTVEYDNWLRTETRTDLFQRLERLADLDYDPGRPTISRSNTTSTFSRTRNRLHNTSTRFGSSNSLVTENSSEFRRRSAHQEWMERLSRLNDERNHLQQVQASESRPVESRGLGSLSTMMGDSRPGLPTPNTGLMAFERLLYGRVDLESEPRQSDPFSFDGDHVMEMSYHSPRRASSMASSWNENPARRPGSLGRSANGSNSPGDINPIQPHRDDPERFSRFLDYIHDYRDSSLYVPSPSDLTLQSGPARNSEEPSTLQRGPREREGQSESWYSRRRHSSSRPSSQSNTDLWGGFAAEYIPERSTESGRSASGFPRNPASARQTDRESSLGEMRPAYDMNRATHPDEASTLAPLSPVGSYLIDVPPLPSPDLSDLLDNVSHYPQTAAHEERLVSARPLNDIPTRLRPRSPLPVPPSLPLPVASRIPSLARLGRDRAARLRPRSPSPAPPPLPIPAAPRISSRPRIERAERAERTSASGRATSFDHLDPELFAPGPYRNTIQSLMRRRDTSPATHSRPPTIPPFPFESNSDRDGVSSRRSRHVYGETYDSRGETSHMHPQRNEISEDVAWGPRQRRPALYVRNEWDDTPSSTPLTSSDDQHRPSHPGSNNDLHTFLTRQVRLEGARIERMERIAEAAAAQLNEASSNSSRFNHVIEVLRSDGGLSRRHQPADRPLGPRSSGDGSRERPTGDWIHAPPVRRQRLRARRVRPLGDYMRDEDFDESYESLLSLAAAIGDVKPRSTPEEVISKLETATYKDWTTPDSDKRCPICLDDYDPNDHVMKAGACSHWLHKECLHQWLKSANTCPVCRMAIHSPRIRQAHGRRPPRSQPVPSSSASGNNHGHNTPYHNNNNDRQDETMNQAETTTTTTTTTAPSNNAEPTSPFLARSRNFGGWSGWRYYHP